MNKEGGGDGIYLPAPEELYEIIMKRSEELKRAQVSLDTEAAAVLDRNRWELYE